MKPLPEEFQALPSEQVEAIQRYRRHVQDKKESARRQRFIPEIELVYGHLSREAKEVLAEELYRNTRREQMLETWRTRNLQTAN